MILDTYYKNLATQMCGNPNSLTFKDYDGTTRTYGKPTNSYGPRNMAITTYFEEMSTVVKSINYVGVMFGDGTAEVSKDDYKLSGNIIKTITASAKDQSTHNDGQVIKSTLYTITNTGDNPITISEIGYFGYVGYDNTYVCTLVERTLLETPLTIQAGGIGQVEYTIRMNYPTA